MKLNVPVKRYGLKTFEGARAGNIKPADELRRSVLACLLWEDQFYESGVTISERIAELVPKVAPSEVKRIAIEARKKMRLRHAPLWLVKEMTEQTKHRFLVAEVLKGVIDRPDEMAEFLAMYWANGKRPLANQVKKGLAGVFGKFDEYQLAKYDRDAAVRLRDVMFMVHPKPRDDKQALTFKALAQGDKLTADTWEVALSAGDTEKTSADKKARWERLLKDKRLGVLALIRNLRNMETVQVDRNLIREALNGATPGRTLPFRFVAAAQYAPRYERQLEKLMFRAAEDQSKLKGKTVILVDVSYSMIGAKVSKSSEMDRLDAASALAMIAREICQQSSVYTFSTKLALIPDRNGFALRDKIKSQPNAGTYLGRAIRDLNKRENYDRLIVITDEQSHDTVGDPLSRAAGYMINVASYRNSVAYGRWTSITGWSEAIFQYISELEG